MDFVAIDLETANADMASICQIGIVRYENGAAVEEWKTYVDPKDDFDGVNVGIHGIDEDTVKGAPTFLEVADRLHGFLAGAVAVCHTHFDRVALQQAAHRHGIAPPACDWLDTARVARRAWEQFARKGYGLANVCRTLGYSFGHHDALEDAKAAAYVLLCACEQTGLDLDGWQKRVARRIGSGAGSATIEEKREANPEGPLYGEVMVFTGALSMPRPVYADMAAALGCEVRPGVTKKTTLLVVGDQDTTKLAGHNKSSKHRKAEALIAAGAPIRILRETDFRELARMAGEQEPSTS